MQIAKITLGRDLVRARENSRDEVLFAMQVGAPSAISGVLNQLGTIIAEGSLFLIVVLGFLVIDPWITLAAIGYFVIIAYLIQFFVGTLMKRAGESVASGTVGASSSLNDLISVFRESSVLRNRSYYLKRILEFRSKASRGAASQYFLSGMPRYILESALLIGVGAFVVLQSLSSDLVASAATIGIFLSGGFRLTAAMLPLQSALLTMKALLPAAGTAHEILALRTGDETTPRVENPLSHTSVRIDSPAARGIGVSVRGVTYGYPGRGELVLEDLSMEIPAGSQVAIIGPSGAGKSTIADIICGLITPNKGSVELSFPGSRSQSDIQPTVSYVPQKPGLVAGTIAQNVALGIDEKLIDRELVSECLERSHLSDIVGALPNGIDSDLGKLQDNLSGGQAQRLGLARALYTFPGLLVMDEATSALDGESESEIAKVLESLRGSVTVVLIAHRLNTVQHANNVFLLQNGRIVDEGSFLDLVKRNPSMQKLVAHTQVRTKE
jgi:ATP-binding cassette subfamily C protein